MNIETRKDLSEYFYQTLLKKDELEEDKEKIDIKPKSFIIESNIKVEDALNNGEWTIKRTKDTDLLILRYRGKIEFFLDILDKRFWIFHSLSPSNTVSEILKSLVMKNNSKLDFIWLSSTILEKIVTLGKQTAFGLKFDNKFIKDEEKEIEHVSMRFWGGPAKEIINDLKNNPRIKQAVTLSNIGLKYSPTENLFIKENISFIGKFTVIKGIAIEPHFNLINRVKDLYSDLINKIEENYRISYVKNDNKISFKGDFLLIEFSKPLQDIEMFIETITSCRFPFRIWGIWDKLEKDYIKANCVDLHSGNKIYLELTPQWMRIYLEKNACGNIVARLFTNLQQFFDSQIKLYGAESEKIM